MSSTSLSHKASRAKAQAVLNVFEIERYGTEDGPGIRTVVFLKGCNLRCRWCQNPESQSPEPQVMYYKTQCVACRRCVEACPADAIVVSPNQGFLTDHTKCIRCGACVDACFTNARKMIGQRMTVEEVMKEVRKDKQFYDTSGGGVTFSGGEPLLQAEVLAQVATRCRQEGIHVALETAGHVRWETIESILPVINRVYMDLKHIDSEEHRLHTGVPNDRILENIRKTAELATDFVLRVPVVPGVNDTEDVQNRIFEYLANKTNVRVVELLPFHKLGVSKFEGLGMQYTMQDAQNMSKAECEPFAEIGRRYGLTVRVGAGD